MTIEEILDQLDSMRAYVGYDGTVVDKAYINACDAASALLRELLGAGIRDLDELRDVRADDAQRVNEWREMVRLYRTETRPTVKGDIVICPECGRRVSVNNSHCHRCGKKLGWGRVR